MRPAVPASAPSYDATLSRRSELVRLDDPAPSRSARLAVALLVAAAAAAYATHVAHAEPGYTSDFDQIWAAARALGRGTSPYQEIGPGRHFEYEFPFFYPLPAVILSWPLAWLPLVAARAAFCAVTTGLLAWAVTRESWARLPLFASMGFVHCVVLVQWSPLLIAATLLPALGGVLLAKPNLGLALAAARLTDPRPGAPRRWAAAAIAGGTALLGASFAAWPSWTAEWLANLHSAGHVSAPLLRAGGPLLLLAALRWRQPEARLLLALACTPQTPIVVEALPLFLVTRSTREALWLAIFSYVAYIGGGLTWDGRTTSSYFHAAGIASVVALYLPCLVIVLRRPNRGPVPAWADRLAAKVAGKP